MLTEKESDRLLNSWNDTAAEYPRDCIHQLFEAQAERTPDSVAVVFEDERLTYRELNAKANQLARYLQRLGVEPEVLVGLCVERSLDMVVAMLGILKAGGAYVPLDPAYPAERLAFMLANSQASVLLTQKQLVSQLPDFQGRILCIDRDWEAISKESKDNLPNSATLENLAYVIYTSGSTGKPKGVMMGQRALVNLICWQIEQTMPKNAKTLQFSTISFDVSFQEIFTTFCGGGTLVLISEEVRRDPVTLLHLLAEKEVERIFLPFVALQQLAEVAENFKLLPGSLREVITAGEQLQVTGAIASFFTKLPNCTLQNQYGPSETHVVTAFTLKGSPQEWPALPPIGRPIANIEVYLLDDSLQPVPIGVAGELYFGGVGLARGYINRPELTKERFIANPFNPESSRLYKTGDLARYLTDGNIQFFGRIDSQVKIRGYRIEIGEIEVVLSEHPEVKQAVVVAREDIPGGKRLVAYVVPGSEETGAPKLDGIIEKEQVQQWKKIWDEAYGKPADDWESGFHIGGWYDSYTGKTGSKPNQLIPQLRYFLKEKLPEYMVPTAFVVLDKLPLTPSGKVDRRALPAPDRSRPVMDVELVSPRTPTEEILVGIWTEVLSLNEVGVFDNFFMLGGNSIQATQLISRVRNIFTIDLSLDRLFESPSVAAFSEDILGASIQDLAAIQPITRQGKLPLSFAEQGLWFLDKLQEISTTYNEQEALRLTGSLEVEVLQVALQEIVRRHEVLRTNFKEVDGSPVRVIFPELGLQIPIIDLQHLPAEEQLSAVQQLGDREIHQPFDLAKDPLLRVTLLQLATDDYVLLLTMHHIITDGWSMGVFSHELEALYGAFVRGKPSPLPKLPIQYADFAYWQKQPATAEVLATQLNYWKQQLAGAPPLLELPTDYPRKTVQTSQGSKEFFELGVEFTQQLKRLSQERGVTLFMTLLAAFSTLLYRYSGQEDIVVGTPIANRNRSEIEALIGFFVNILVLRTQFQYNPSFTELLTQVRQNALNAYTHQDVPFEQLVESLQPERSLSYTPIFQVMFALQNAPRKPLELPGVSFKWLPLENSQAPFNLFLSMEDTETGLSGYWEYNRDLFSSETIRRMMVVFKILLKQIVINPQGRVGQLPLLTPSERHQLLVECNHTQGYPQDKCVHQLFEEQVERTPDAVAVVFEEERLTYRELNGKANQLANYLQGLGVGAEVLVGICVERSIEMIVGLLGILKAGGAYVPFDSNSPPERLAFMLADAGISIIVTEEKLKSAIPSLPDVVICLDTDWQQKIAPKAPSNPIGSVESSSLAYIIYTSGSTGQPKGVLIQHNNVTRLFAATESWFSFNSSDVWTLFHSYAFDFSVWEIWGALLHGGTLVVVPYWISRSPKDFYELLCLHKVTFLNQTPSAFRQLIQIEDSLSSDRPLHLRYVIFGGEALEIKSLEPWFERHGDSSPQVINMYGITETTVHVTYRPLTLSDVNRNSSPIGSPIPDLQVYILDNYLQPVPIGVPGELHIGGAGLARGYLNRPKLTEQKFIPNPFSDESGSRLYKTGDKARYLPDGNIEFIGRIDNQVKIRGFRIELGEIEATLAQHPEVCEAVVIVREDSTGYKRLVAYIVPEGEELAGSVLRSFLKSKLPDYMVPSAFVFLEAIPLTANGKVNRRALPAPDTEHLSESASFIPPRSNTELQLSQIWSEVLKVSPVGVTNNFFDLGGHSLLAVRLMARIERQLGIHLPLATLFTEPTIESQANLLKAKSDVRSPSVLVPIQASGEKPPLFCVHPVGGNVLCYAELARHLGKNQPLYGLQSLGLSGEKEPLTKIEDMAAIYIEALQEIKPACPYYLSGWSMGGVVAWEMARQLLSLGQEVALVALIDSYAPSAISELEEIDEATLANSLAADLGGMFGTELPISASDIEQLQPEEQLQGILAAAKCLNLLPPEVGIEQMRRLFQVFKANRIAIANYQPQPYSGRVVQFCASSPQEDRGWSYLVTGELETHVIPGDHYGMMLQPHVRVLAQKLGACLN